jgi:transposase
VGRTLGLDVHKRFAEVAVHEEGEVRRLGRIETKDLQAFAASLSSEDHVVLESTSLTWAIAELLGRYAGRVTVSNPMKTRAIASAKVKTDKVDARVLAELGAAEFVPEVWAPDQATRALRRRIAHRASLVRQRTRLRNQIHAVLARSSSSSTRPMHSARRVGGCWPRSSCRRTSATRSSRRCACTTRSITRSSWPKAFWLSWRCTAPRCGG